MWAWVSCAAACEERHDEMKATYLLAVEGRKSSGRARWRCAGIAQQKTPARVKGSRRAQRGHGSSSCNCEEKEH